MRIWYKDALLLIAVVTLVFIALVMGRAEFEAHAQSELIKAWDGSSIVETHFIEVEPQLTQDEQISLWTTRAIAEFIDTPYQRSEAEMIMHCLLHWESGHTPLQEDDTHGDGGRAGGSLQFHQGTWDGFRKIMIKQGHAKEIGSRYDMQEAIRTTVWAISDGRAKNWGPILREANGSDHNTCPVPSWSK